MTKLNFILPVVRSRSDPGHHRKASWLELFYDLVFVFAIAQLGHTLADDYSLHSLIRYGFLFVLVWWAWLGQTLYSTRFEADDGLQRLYTLLQICAAAVMSANAKGMLDSRDTAGFAAAYAVMRFVLVLQYARVRHVSESKTTIHRHIVGFGTAAALWLISALTPPPTRFVIWGVALSIDLATPWIASRQTQKFPPNPTHLPERFGLFTLILLGEMVAATMRGMEKQESWPMSAALSAFASLFFAFIIWAWYFDWAEGANDRHVNSRSDSNKFFFWCNAHFLLYFSLAVTGVGLEHVIANLPAFHLHKEELAILIGSATSLAVSLVIIGETKSKIRWAWDEASRFLRRLALACSPLILLFLPTHLLANVIVIALVAFFGTQILFSARSSKRALETPSSMYSRPLSTNP